jgi:hypothetical protein
VRHPWPRHPSLEALQEGGKDASDLTYDRRRVPDVLEHLRAQHAVETFLLEWELLGWGDDVDPRASGEVQSNVLP